MHKSKSTSSNYATIVGSRETPGEEALLLKKVGFLLANAGWIIRSGHSGEADMAGENGVLLSNRPDNLEIFLPWSTFAIKDNPRNADPSCYYVATEMENQTKARSIAASVVGHWNELNDGGKLLHGRNPYQVLGIELNHPSDLLFCYAKPDTKVGQYKGGTNTAIQIAMRKRVPVFNLYYEGTRSIVEMLVKDVKLD